MHSAKNKIVRLLVAAIATCASAWTQAQSNELKIPPVIDERGEALEYYGGGDFHDDGLWEEYLRYVESGQSPYYTMEDINNYIPGLEFSSAAIELPELVGEHNLFATLPEVDIPVHFITSTKDRNTPPELARLYYEALKAPDKSFTFIENAAHMVIFEQPQAWADALIRIKFDTLGE